MNNPRKPIIMEHSFREVVPGGIHLACMQWNGIEAKLTSASVMSDSVAFGPRISFSAASADVTPLLYLFQAISCKPNFIDAYRSIQVHTVIRKEEGLTHET